MQLGDRIKEIRLSKQMKQSDLAEKANISRVAVGNYERNDRQPTAEILQRIASALEVQPNTLLGWNEIEEKVKKEYLFVSYLKSLGYAYVEKPGDVISKHFEDVDTGNGEVHHVEIIDEQKCDYILSKDGTTAEFTQDEFEALQYRSKESIEFEVFKQCQKNKKEPPSAATENGSKVENYKNK